MEFISLTAFLALAGETAPANPEATSGVAEKAKPAKVATTEGYICPLTGQVLPCPDCCPAAAKK